MKLLCETSVVNRTCQTHNKSRFMKSTLAVVKHPPRDENAEILVMLFTTQNKIGQRYKVRNNLKKVFTRCVEDGKITLSFNIPEHDILIKSDPLQLKCFLRILKLGVEGKAEMNNIGISNISVTAAPLKSHPPKKMLIKSRGDIPLKGYPRSLTSLSIIGIDRPRFDGQILCLKNLTTLDLSNNSIKTIPKQFGEMQVSELHLSDNQFGYQNLGCNNWSWMDGIGIRKNLKLLDLSGNGLVKFPTNLLNLKKLITLKLDRNSLTQIPFAIDRLQNLRHLDVSNNGLHTLPANLAKHRFDTLNVSQNNYLTFGYQPRSLDMNVRDVKLWKLAAEIITKHKVPYTCTSIPRVLFTILDRTPQCSLCNVFCFSSVIYQKCFTVELSAKELIKDCDQILGDYIFCKKCQSKKKNTLNL